jgi:hypothetical protein
MWFEYFTERNPDVATAKVAGDVPAAADIETRLEGTKNAVFAKYAFGVRR